QFERLGLRVLLHADERLPVDLLRRNVVAIAAAGVDRSILADRWARARPEPSAPRRPVTNLLGREIVRVEVVGIPAAALRRRGVDHAIDQIERVWLSVGRHE